MTVYIEKLKEEINKLKIKHIQINLNLNIKMKHIFDFFIGIIFGTIFTITFMDYEVIKQLWWIGIVIGWAMLFTLMKNDKDELEKLKEEINKLKNGNR